MRATGIVRRMDDLGRVVIPKEIRRAMRLREGAPLEIFTHNGAVCFKPYVAIGEKDFIQAKNIVEVLLPCDFALLDCYETVQASVGEGDFDEEYGIVVDGDTVAFLAVNGVESQEDGVNAAITKAVMILQKLFADEG